MSEHEQLQSQVRRDLAGIFADELGALKPLCTLMTQESDALKARDASQVLVLTVAKEALLQQLQITSTRRIQTLQLLGFDANAQSLEQLLIWCDAEPELRESADTVMSLTRQCHELNVQNGIQINKNQKFVNRSLNVLLGVEDVGFAGYTASGTRSEEGGHRTITTI